MFKVTCLVAPRRKVGTPRKLGLVSPRKTVPAQCYLSWSKHMQSINKMQPTCVIWMHRKKDEVILRILAQESLVLELGWKDMEFWSFGAIFVDFSEARDLFGIIFQILGPNYKIMDRRLIFTNGRDLIANRLGFRILRDLFCRNSMD
jgi:hypothetical protein